MQLYSGLKGHEIKGQCAIKNMQKLVSIVLLVITTILISCKEENQQPDCSLYLCDCSLSINLRFVDKNTNTDLLFNPASSYSITDLKIYRHDTLYFPLPISIDTTNNTVIIKCIQSGDLIQLGNLPADKIITQTRATTRKVCCPPIEVIKLAIGDRMVCQPCKNLDERIIIVEK